MPRLSKMRATTIEESQESRKRGRERTREEQAIMAEQLRTENPELSWAQIAKKVDPNGFSRNQRQTREAFEVQNLNLEWTCRGSIR